MRESIEDRIIAYFDGRLTDDESADLLHRVSISPEIRKLFREHEMLREMAHTAQATTVVRPEVEANLFARIEAIASGSNEAIPVTAEPERKRRVIAPLFWTRWRLGLATATGAFLIGTVIMLGPEWIGNNDRTAIEREQTTAPRSQQGVGESNREPAPLTSPDKFETPQEYASSPDAPSSKPDFGKQTGGDRNYKERMATSERPRAIGAHTREMNVPPASNDAITSNDRIVASETPVQQIDTVAVVATPINVGGEKGITPVFRVTDLENTDRDHFEISIESSTGFAYPASDPGVEPFADARMSLGYFIDNNNIVGLRATYGLFEILPEPKSSQSSAYNTIERDLETVRLFSPGAYYTHREYSVLGDYINLDATVGAGLISNGYTLSGELGLRFPLSNRINGAISFALTRVHINASTMGEMAEATMRIDDALGRPVIFEGSDIRNTLNGRIQYGLSYQF